MKSIDLIPKTREGIGSKTREGIGRSSGSPLLERQRIPNYRIYVSDFAKFLRCISQGSVDLILTDPPYTISRKTGFKNIGSKSVERFAVDMDFGEWDQSPIDLRKLCELSYRCLRPGGTAIIFYDVWKISHLAEAMIGAGLTQLRLIEWRKTNPVPLNSKRNYLTNSREIAVMGVKGGKPTFHGKYDNGTYNYPIPNNGKRLHPTQKPLELFESLVRKHSNPGDLIVDPFLGSGTTAIAVIESGRCFKGCDNDRGYVESTRKRVKECLRKIFRREICSRDLDRQTTKNFPSTFR